MTTYQAGDLLLIQFSQTSGTPGALRPGLVLIDTGDLDVVVARITRQTYRTPHDVEVTDWRTAGLVGPSVIRLHKIATVEKALIQRKLGSLQATDRAAVANVLQQTFGNW
jgi:mRNA interferase MazF